MSQLAKFGVIISVVLLCFALDKACYAQDIVYHVFGPPEDDIVGPPPDIRDSNYYFFLRPSYSMDGYSDSEDAPMINDMYVGRDYRGWIIN